MSTEKEKEKRNNGNLAHICRLGKHEYDPIDIYYKNRKGFLVKIEKCWKRLTTICPWNPRVQVYCRSQAHISEDITRQLSLPWYNLHPLSQFRIYWETIICIATLTILIVLPLDWAFMFYPNLKANIHTKRLFEVCQICQAFSAADIFLNFATGYYESSSKVCFMRHRIFMNYIKSAHFIHDVASNIPHIYLSREIKNHFIEDLQFYVLFHIVTALKVFRLRILLRYGRHLTWLYVKKNCYLKISMLILVSVIVMQWSMAWILNASSLGSGLYLYGVPTANKTWMTYTNLWNSTRLRLHANGILLATCYLLGTGTIYKITDIAIGQYSNLELLTEVLLRIIGRVCCMFILAVGLYIYRAMLPTSTRFYSIVSNMKHYMDYAHVCERNRTRLIRYMEYKYKTFYFEDFSRTDEMLTVKILKILKHLHLFNELPRSALRLVAKSITSEIYLPGDIITHVGSTSKDIYFVASGTVGFYTVHGVEIYHLSDGDYFGLWTLLNFDKCPYCTFALEPTELYCLDFDVFKKILQEFPNLQFKFLQEAEFRATLGMNLEYKCNEFYRPISETELASFNLSPRL